MAIFRKNIWTIFYILLAGAFLFLGIISYLKWNSIHEKYATDQTNLVKLVANATHSLFLSQEMTLNILGNQILKDNDPRIMDDLLELNPSVVAFGFVDTDGNYLHVSSNFHKTKLPNLRQQAVSKDSFEYTMTQEKMVLGRTYFIAGSGRWGIPIRKSIYNDEGKLIGVMTAGLAIEGAFKIFAENLSIGDYNKVMLIRDRDQFVQFQSSNHAIPNDLYAKPLPNNFLNTVLKQVTEQTHLSIEEIKHTFEIYLVEFTHADGNVVQIALKYDPRYELWVLSEIDHNQITQDFLQNFMVYLFIFIIVHIILFLLFKIIAHAETIRNQELIFQATHDALTKLPNRSYLQQSIHQWIYDKAPPFSLYYLDMDHFKNINDSFGHQFGDLLLIECAKRISALVRKESVVIRQGGDEFVILTYRTEDEDIRTHSQTILSEISKPYHNPNC